MKKLHEQANRRTIRLIMAAYANVSLLAQSLS